MKKVLVILLILAVSAGAFAQGEWGVSAGARVYATLDGGPNAVGSANSSTIVGSYSDTFAKITYKIGGFDSSIQFNWGGNIGFGVTGSGDNYKFKVSADFRPAPISVVMVDNPNYGVTGDPTESQPMIANTSVGSFFNQGNLWGWYDFDLFGAGTLRAHISLNDGDYEWMWNSGAPYDERFANARSDKLTLNATIDALQVGFIIPFFPSNPQDIMQSSFEKMTFGVKYDMADVFDAGLNFGMNGDGTTINNGYSNKIYIGANLKMLSPISISLAFFGDFAAKAEDGDATLISFSAKVGYAEGDLEVSVKGQFASTTFKGASSSDFSSSVIKVEPFFRYNIIPESLRFTLAVPMEFTTDNFLGTATKSSEIHIKPQLIYNFLQNGTNGFGDLNTALYVEYDLGFSKIGDADSAIINSEAKIGFRWGI